MEEVVEESVEEPESLDERVEMALENALDTAVDTDWPPPGDDVGFEAVLTACGSEMPEARIELA